MDKLEFDRIMAQLQQLNKAVAEIEKDLRLLVGEIMKKSKYPRVRVTDSVAIKQAGKGVT